MDAPALKNKRRKKNKSRTEVSDSESESPAAPSSHAQSPTAESHTPKSQTANRDAGKNSMTDEQVAAAFTQFYTRQAAQEFAEDLDRVRQAEDFNNDALPLLITALQQGAGLFSVDEQRRVVLAEREKERVGG